MPRSQSPTDSDESNVPYDPRDPVRLSRIGALLANHILLIPRKVEWAEEIRRMN